MHPVEALIAAAWPVLDSPTPDNLDRLRIACQLARRTAVAHYDSASKKLFGSLGEQNVTGTEDKIISALLRSRGQVLDKNALCAILYGERADGGPDGADAVIKQMIARLRKKIRLAGCALEIQTAYMQGYAVVVRSAVGTVSCASD